MRKYIIVILSIVPIFSYAGGFQLNLQGVKAIGMGGAFTGIGSNASSVFFNPGALTKLNGHSFIFGTSFVNPKISLQTPQNSNIDQTSGGTTPFHIYYSGSLLKEKLKNRLKVGFLINNQFGAKSSFKSDWQGRFIVQNVSLKTYMFQPTLSYKLHTKLSIGGGFVFTSGNFRLEKALPFSSVNSTEGQTKLKGKGNAMGFNLGVYSQFLTIGDKEKKHIEFAAGINYRSELNVQLKDGEATFTNIPPSLLSTFPPTLNFNSKLTLPAVSTIGLSAKYIMENWTMEFAYDFNWTGWSSYDSLNFNFNNISTPDLKELQNWEDVITHRLGVDFTYKNKYSLRGGLYYDITPIKDGFLTPYLPDATQLAYTFGGGYIVSDFISIDLAYILQNSERKGSLDSAGFIANYRRIVNVCSIALNLTLRSRKKKIVTE